MATGLIRNLALVHVVACSTEHVLLCNGHSIPIPRTHREVIIMLVTLIIAIIQNKETTGGWGGGAGRTPLDIIMLSYIGVN